MNKYTVKLPDAVLATAGADPITGISSSRWKNKNTEPLGFAADFAVGDGLIFQDAIVTSLTDTGLSKIVSMNIGNTTRTTNGIQIPLSALEFSKDVNILGVVPIGLQRHATGPITVSSLVSSADAFENIVISVLGDDLLIKYGAEIIDYTLNIIIYYR